MRLVAGPGAAAALFERAMVAVHAHTQVGARCLPLLLLPRRFFCPFFGGGHPFFSGNRATGRTFIPTFWECGNSLTTAPRDSPPSQDPENASSRGEARELLLAALDMAFREADAAAPRSGRAAAATLGGPAAVLGPPAPPSLLPLPGPVARVALRCRFELACLRFEEERLHDGQNTTGKTQRAKHNGQKTTGKTQRAKHNGQKTTGKTQRAKHKNPSSQQFV